MDPMTAMLGLQGVGSLFGMFGSRGAARAQEAASREQLALQQQQYDQGRADLQPYTQTGYNALNALGSIYGLPQVSYQPPPAPQQSAPQIIPANMPNTEGNIVQLPDGGYALSTLSEGGAAKLVPLPNYQPPQASQPGGQTMGGFFSNLGRQFANFAQNPGMGALTGRPSTPSSDNLEWDRYGGQFSDDYVVTPENFNMVEDPGYRFRMKEAMDAINAAGNARGGFFSGATMNALGQRAGEMASDEFGAAYGRARTAGLDRYAYDADQYGRKVSGFRNFLTGLSSMAAGGQNAASGSATLGANFANAGSNALANRGDAIAAGRVGMANAFTNGINNGVGIYSYFNPPAWQQQAS